MPFFTGRPGGANVIFDTRIVSGKQELTHWLDERQWRNAAQAVYLEGCLMNIQTDIRVIVHRVLLPVVV